MIKTLIECWSISLCLATRQKLAWQTQKGTKSATKRRKNGRECKIEWAKTLKTNKNISMSAGPKNRIKFECHWRTTTRSVRGKENIDTRQAGVQLSPPRARDPSYITSQSTHFLNVPHLWSVKGGSTVERWLILYLKSAVKWQGNINEMKQNRENELMNKMNEWIDELKRKKRVRWIDMNKNKADR